MTMKLYRVLLALLLSGSAQATFFWGGADIRTNGFDVHAGTSVLPIPFLATAGLEAGLGRSSSQGTQVRFGATIRDINIPFSKTDGFVSGGAAYHSGATNTDHNGLGLYVEGGVSGELLGPLGWRIGARSDSKAGFSAGVGLEAKF